MKVEITLKNGRKMRTTEAVARVLRSRMLVAADYQTAVLVSPETQAEVEAPNVGVVESEELEDLRAKARERGIQFHHRAGVAKLRELLSE